MSAGAAMEMLGGGGGAGIQLGENGRDQGIRAYQEEGL